MTEYIDVLDESGNKTGEKKSTDEIHTSGYWHRAAHVWILNPKRELLLQKRAPNKHLFPGMWDISSAGHISSGEDSVTSGLREAEEELGLEFGKDDIKYLFSTKVPVVTNGGKYIDNEFQDVFLIKADVGISEVRIQEEELTEVKFVEVEKLEKMIASNPESFAPHREEYEKLFQILR
jgi:isopentenyldiphosphate isomerase